MIFFFVDVPVRKRLHASGTEFRYSPSFISRVIAKLGISYIVLLFIYFILSTYSSPGSSVFSSS